MIVSVAMMNLVTAVIVEGAISQASSERDVMKAYKCAKVRALLPRLGELFKELDPDGDGYVTLDEILEASNVLKDELENLVQIDDLVEIFQLLDENRTGSLDIDEFIESVTEIATSDLAIEHVRILKQLSLCRGDLTDVRLRLDVMDGRMSLQAVQQGLEPSKFWNQGVNQDSPTESRISDRSKRAIVI